MKNTMKAVNAIVAVEALALGAVIVAGIFDCGIVLEALPYLIPALLAGGAALVALCLRLVALIMNDGKDGE